MEKYKFLPHTADVKFQAFGGSLEEAFTNAALATAHVIVDPSKVETRVRKEIDVESEDKEALLYDFLEQFIILLDSEGFLLHEIKELTIEEGDNTEKSKISGITGRDFKLKAIVVGDNNIDKYEPETHIKAVTYQEMIIKKENDMYMIQVVLDI